MRRDEPHVIHVVPALFGPSGVAGGAERYGLELARAMSHVVATTLVTFGHRTVDDRDGALAIRVLGPAHYVRGQQNNPLTARLLPALRHAAVVHCHQQHILASSLTAIYCRLTGRRVFVTDLGGGGWDISAYVSTDQWYHGHLHISQYSRRVAGHASNPKAHVILGGVDADRFCPGSPAPRSGDVLFVGRILPHKGLDYLIEALPPDLPLTVVGPPADEGYVGELKRLAVGKRVTFRHGVDDAALVDAYRRARCVVLPSVYRTRYGQETRVPELLGQVLLEAMACATPVIATKVASLGEVVDDGTTGFLVPPNDAAALRAKLEWFRERPAEAEAMGAAGRERVTHHFTWPLVVTRCLSAYGLGHNGRWASAPRRGQ